jgi:hypothetical protein
MEHAPANAGLHRAQGFTLLYLPRLLQLYLRPIECSPMDFVRVLAAPTFAAIALFVGHRLLMQTIDVGFWTEIGIVILETLVAYTALTLLQRREIMGKLRSVRALLSSAA